MLGKVDSTSKLTDARSIISRTLEKMLTPLGRVCRRAFGKIDKQNSHCFTMKLELKNEINAYSCIIMVAWLLFSFDEYMRNCEATAEQLRKLLIKAPKNLKRILHAKNHLAIRRFLQNGLSSQLYLTFYNPHFASTLLFRLAVKLCHWTLLSGSVGCNRHSFFRPIVHFWAEFFIFWTTLLLAESFFNGLTLGRSFTRAVDLNSTTS